MKKKKSPKLIALIGFLTYCVTASVLLTIKANMKRDRRADRQNN